ncbi:MAG TPA: M20 family metallopeptidase [Chloroflexota bacterium]|nr:M20 family metallopeptidase [Chloroflexota bacterium]
MAIDREAWDARIRAAVEELTPQLLASSHDIHANPELAFREHRACARLADELEQGGFTVERGAGGLPTAFRAEYRGGEPGPTIAILAEYDALPGIGHGCGHNVIATSALGAGLAIARSGVRFPGTIVVVGTPAEEGGGGKILLAEAGVFEDVDVAYMLHPSQTNMVKRGSLANSRVEVVFHGRAAHAAGAPDLGINALEAVIQTFVGVNARRLHMRDDARVHGIITDGGKAVNIIPDRAAARFSVRARDRAYQRRLIEMVKQAAEAGSLASGAKLEWTETRGYSNMVANVVIADVFAKHLRATDRVVDEPRPNQRMGSTDMGDISQIMPAVHAYLSIAPRDVPNHTVDFTAAAASPAGDKAVVDGALAMAQTAADLFADPSLVALAKAEFQERLDRGEVAGYDAWVESGKAYAPAPRPA